ncbi:MAG: RNA methyltransferase [Bacteroidetes bacterium]|nr:RNA methyltransferase [Bacteroidota bacterium]
MRKIQNDELGRLTVDDFKSAEKRPIVLILDDVRSLNNIGSAFRTADAFRCQSIYLCGITATPPHREIHKTALGAEDSVDWKYEKDVVTAIEILKKDGYTIIGIEQAEGGIMLNEFRQDSTKKYAFIFGHEINGVSEAALALCDHAIEIPQSGTKHAINISVCVGIVVWEFCRKW